MSENFSELSRLITLAEFRYTLRRFLSFSERVSEEEGVSVQHYQLLQVIATVPEGQQASISYVAQRMVLRHNSTVELVDRAERAGLIKRKVDPGDLRRSLVALTAKGVEVLEKLVAVHLAELDSKGTEIVRAMESLLAERVGQQVAA